MTRTRHRLTERRTCIRGFSVLIAMSIVGCSATVIPPAAPAHPTTAYVCDYGYHSSLLLPVGNDGTFVEYLFGDWNWAALNHTGVGSAICAGLFSTGATLGRRYVFDPTPGATPVPMSRPVVQFPIVVDGERCARLVAALDARWHVHDDSALYTGALGGYYLFVRDDEPYGWIHNCNRETEAWLSQLGCGVRGWALLSHFHHPESLRVIAVSAASR